MLLANITQCSIIQILVFGIIPMYAVAVLASINNGEGHTYVQWTWYVLGMTISTLHFVMHEPSP